MSEQQNLLTLEERPESTVEDLLRLASETSTAIFEAEKEALDDAAWIRDQRWRVDSLEANITVIVANLKVYPKDVGPDDPDAEEKARPMFTNETSRKAEVSRRLSIDAAYKELMAALLAAELRQQIRRLTIERLTREFKVAGLSIAFYTAIHKED